jgi:peptide-methionine (R)-S-oxide reductase
VTVRRRITGERHDDNEGGEADDLSPDGSQVSKAAPSVHRQVLDCHDDGVYRCAGCGAELSGASTKYDSGTAGRATEPMFADAVEVHTDRSLGMVRTEVASGAAGIWVTSSTTARAPRASATA